MIYDVKVFSRDGTLKTTVSGQSLAKKKWDALLHDRHSLKNLKEDEPRICPVCNKAFNHKTRGAKYCSNTCIKKDGTERNRRNRINRLLRNHDNAKVVDGVLFFSINCAECNKSLQVKSQTAKFCSRKCSSRSASRKAAEMRASDKTRNSAQTA